jgi:hypothetical protein
MLPTPMIIQGNWPFGKDGDLIITSGNVVTIQAGSIKDYHSIRIDAGCALVIDGTTSTLPTIIGCKTTCVINGVIRNNSGYIAGTFSKTDPFGQTLSYTTVQKLGGDGGLPASGVGATPNSGRGGTDGSGGGGRGGDGSGWAGAGGAGGYNGSGGISGIYNYYPSGSSGGVLVDNGNLTFGDGETTIYGNIAGSKGGGSGGGGGGGNGRGYSEDHNANGGGGGGYRGAHGGCLYLHCLSSITGAGLIDCSGKVGFKGGTGGFDGGHGNYLSYQAGNSGGGGAGGSGGKLKIRCRTAFSVSYSVAGAAGGVGGLANYGDTVTYPGQPGQTGDNGTADIVLI